MTSNLYRIFDITIESEVDLPGLLHCESGEPAWRIVWAERAIDDTGFEWFHAWKDEDGTELMSCARKGGDYLLEIPGLARFRIHIDDGRIEAAALSDCPESTVVHLLLDQVIPRVTCHGGRIVIHASAVMMRNGQAVAFSGPSGYGKSTLASAFLQAGHRALADDCLLIETGRDGPLAIPAYSSLRLWRDSRETVFRDGAPVGSRITSMAHYSDKEQLLFGLEQKAVHRHPVKLSALYLLQQPTGNESLERPGVSPAGGMSSIMALIEALFALDVNHRGIVERNFTRAGALMEQLPVFHLDYPRRYELLPEIVELVYQYTAEQL